MARRETIIPLMPPKYLDSLNKTTERFLERMERSDLQLRIQTLEEKVKKASEEYQNAKRQSAEERAWRRVKDKLERKLDDVRERYAEKLTKQILREMREDDDTDEE